MECITYQAFDSFAASIIAASIPGRGVLPYIDSVGVCVAPKIMVLDPRFFDILLLRGQANPNKPWIYIRQGLLYAAQS